MIWFNNQKATTGLSVKNGFTVPTVNVTKRIVDSTDEPTITEVLTTNVDMNNNTSEHESIIDLVGASTFVAANAATIAGGTNHSDNGTITNDFIAFTNLTNDGSKVTVKYAVVEESGINFLIPINATFKTE